MKLSPNLRSLRFKELTVFASLGLSALYLSQNNAQITQATANTKTKITDTLDPGNQPEKNTKLKGKAGILQLLAKLEAKLKVYSNDQKPFTKDITGPHGEVLKLSIKYSGQNISIYYAGQQWSIRLADFKENVQNPQAGYRICQFLEAFSKDKMLSNKDGDAVKAMMEAKRDAFSGSQIDKIISLFDQSADKAKEPLSTDDIMIAILKTIHDQL